MTTPNQILAPGNCRRAGWTVRLCCCLLVALGHTSPGVPGFAQSSAGWVTIHEPVRVPGPTVTAIAGEPVELFGNLYVYSLSPEYQPENQIQLNNQRPLKRVHPLKPWQIESNPFGVPARLVDGGFNSRYSFFSPHAEVEQYWPVHLIDGDPKTFWMVRRDEPYEQLDREEPVSIRVDLPYETTITQVVMRAMSEGPPARGYAALEANGKPVAEEDIYYNPFPRRLTIEVSLNDKDWDEVYSTQSLTRIGMGEAHRFTLNPIRAKEVRLTGSDLDSFVNPKLGEGIQSLYFRHNWAFAELEILDQSRANVGAAARGAGITIDEGPVKTWDFDVKNDVSLAVRYDIGAKWLRANYWGGNLLWHNVEQQPGVYVIDPVSDLGVSQAAANGINIVMGLEYGNWLYNEPPRPNLLKQFDPIIYDPPPVPKSDAQINAYLNWVEFMVAHFKDRVQWWEIWNEPSTLRERYGFGPDAEGCRHYAQLIEKAIRRIRQADPAARVLISNSYWEWPLFRDEVMKRVGHEIDALELHIRVYEWDVEGEKYRNLIPAIKASQIEARKLGFKGIFMSQENQWFGEPAARGMWGTQYKPSYLGQAKNMARLLVQNAALDIVTFWQGGFQMESGTLAPSYYVYRTLCTVLDGTRPSEIESRANLELEPSSGTPGIPSRPLPQPDVFTFSNHRGDTIISLALSGRARDNTPGMPFSLEFHAPGCDQVEAIDTLNGTIQSLDFVRHGETVAIPHVLLRDYPLILRMTSAQGVERQATRPGKSKPEPKP